MSVSEQSNSRGLIRSMLVMGSAQAANIMISILRMKVLAVLLGPSGVGLLSIYSSLQGTVAQMAGLGMGSSGVREIASAGGKDETLGQVRRVLFVAHLVQGILAMLAVWLLQDQISMWLFGDASRGVEVAWIGVAILVTLLSAAQTALLQGMRRIGDLARTTILAAFLGTLAGLAAVWAYGERGLVWFVLAQPLISFLVALNYTRSLPRPADVQSRSAELWGVWKRLVKLGLAFMLSGVATALALLLVRGFVSRELGLDAAGQFAAAWGITMIYVGFLLGAMAADYYPRLTDIIKDRGAAVRLMNDQTQLSLAIGGPILLLLIGLAPWVITLLYSAEFGPAASLLQWQTFGNIFKLASWAMAFSIVSDARAKTYFFMEMSFSVVFLGLVLFLLPYVGLEVTAYAFVAGYLVYIATVYLLVRRIHGFRWEPLSLCLLALHAALASGLLALALVAPVMAAVASPLLAVMTGFFGLRVVLTKTGPEGRLASGLAGFYEAIGWPIRGAA
ncbi:O-antigen translocase [Gemmobacter sp.]|uniref:O-antigen translocase n=1 Tax=Gemmobacter sp. TaxID=1898957 RepID=UPI002AFE0945|nr:O-antigen translocase [Gemmobacter sp.]